MTWLLAHQGGWDELLIFAVPAILAVLGLRWAERRSRARSEEKGTPSASLRSAPPPAKLGEEDDEEQPLRSEDGGL
ncbi:MAG: hypothetical protein ACE5MI_07420 [Acidimicrobiia bacterium]